MPRQPLQKVRPNENGWIARSRDLINPAAAVPAPLISDTRPDGRNIPRRLRGDVADSIILGMTAATKLLVAMRRNSLDWQIAQLQTVARQHGIDWRHDGGSHCVFVRSDGKTLPVPAHRPIKAIYVKKFVELVDGA